MNQNESIVNSKKAARRNIVKLIVVILILTAAGIVYNIGGCSDPQIRSIYTAESSSNYQITEFNGDILAVSYDGAAIFSKTGTEKAKVENRMSNPHVDTSGEYMLLYDKGGKTVSLYNGTKRAYSYECENTVKKAKVNKRGYVLIISDEVGYNAGITVLTPKGIVEYIWKIGDVYIIDADISPDSKKITAAAISTDSGVIEENIIFADISREEETARVKNSGSMPMYVSFSDSGNPIVVSDDRLCGYNFSGEKKWEVSYGNKLLNSFEIDENGNSVLALSGIKNNTIVEMYTKNGTKAGEYVTETEINALNVNGKYIALCEPAKISVINYSGKLLDSVDTKKEYSDILITDRKSVILMGTGSIDLLEL